jgi:peptidoglycan/LPS O-acetylase OafA/YrhL
MCYTIYLIHLPLLEALTPLTNKLVFTHIFGLHLMWQALLVFPVVFVVSAAGFLWLEKPCMDKDWPAKLWARIRNSSLVLNNTKES